MNNHKNGGYFGEEKKWKMNGFSISSINTGHYSSSFSVLFYESQVMQTLAIEGISQTDLKY